VLASVYRLRASGALLPRPAEPVQGDLRLSNEAGGDGALIARLMGGAAREVLPPLMHAQVRAVTAHGLVIRGIEAHSRGQQKSRVRYAPQTWWAFILTDDGVDRFDGDDPLRALEEEKTSRRLVGRQVPARN
jgi:hypothetical protein